MDLLSSKTLQHYIDDNRIQAALIHLDQHTPTVREAACALGVETLLVIKSLVFMARKEPILVITNGMARVDRRKLAKHLKIGRNSVKFASADKTLDITGFVVGSMPPFGHRQKMRCFVDPAVTSQEVVFGGGGDIDAMMRITVAELMRVTGAEILDLSEEAGLNN